MPKVIQVIISEQVRGRGTEKCPLQTVPQLFTLDGRLICESETVYEELDEIRYIQIVDPNVLNSLK